MRRDGWPALDAADTLLQIPDLITYFLTGVKAVERSHVQTGNLTNLQVVETEHKAGAPVWISVNAAVLFHPIAVRLTMRQSLLMFASPGEFWRRCGSWLLPCP